MICFLPALSRNWAPVQFVACTGMSGQLISWRPSQNHMHVFAGAAAALDLGMLTRTLAAGIMMGHCSGRLSSILLSFGVPPPPGYSC